MIFWFWRLKPTLPPKTAINPDNTVYANVSDPSLPPWVTMQWFFISAFAREGYTWGKFNIRDLSEVLLYPGFYR